MEIFDRTQFKIQAESISLNHCGYSPLYGEAADAASNMLREQARLGSGSLTTAAQALDQFHEAGATLLKTDRSNISFIPNSCTGLNIIALGYPFNEGDEIVSYRYEYPSNHYPWKNLENQGIKLKLIEGELDDGKPLRWDLAELRTQISDRTRMVALSHVQFVSGFSADLKALGAFCQQRGIKLVIDATQSVGCMPVYPEELGIDALVVSGWKWLMGPIGSALLYTSPTFRQSIKDVLVGPDMMAQRGGYLDHTICPVTTGRKYEFSTLPPSIVAGLGTAIERVVNRHGIERIWERVKHLQNLLLAEIDSSRLRLVQLDENERSGILSFSVSGDPNTVISILKNDGIICSARGTPDGRFYLRCAPHFYLSDAEIKKAASALTRATQIAASVGERSAQ